MTCMEDGCTDPCAIRLRYSWDAEKGCFFKGSIAKERFNVSFITNFVIRGEI